MSENKHALTILPAAGKFALQECDFDRAGKILNVQLALVRQANPLIAKRAIFIGTTLLVVKASLAHGEFGPWLNKHIDDLGRRQVNYYMRLALAVLEAQKVGERSIANLPGTDIETALTVSKGPAGEFRAAVEKFVGDSSLADLLAEHCGKTKSAAKKKGDEAEAAHAVTVQDRFNELDHALRTRADKAIWMSLSKRQHEDLRATAQATAAYYTELYVKTHGRPKA